MTGNDLSRAGLNSLSWLLILAVAFAVAATLFVVVGLPWLWQLLKPWLHALTA